MSRRLLSLDAFRGLAILGMLIVNNLDTGTYTQLNHSPWNGWTLADTIFPAFLVIMGISLAFSFHKQLSCGVGRKVIFAKVVRRSFLLFLIGIFIYNFPVYNLASIRIMGVLQRIAICNLAAGLIFLTLSRRWHIVWTALLLVGYWLVLWYVPFPGHHVGQLTRESNIVSYIDMRVLNQHLYSKDFDPEGLISTFSAFTTTFFGMLAGQFLLSLLSRPKKALYLFISGGILVSSGIVLSNWMPINKNLWTPSYSVFMSGLALCFFAVLYYLIDEKGYRWVGIPLAVLGVNALGIYVLASLLNKLLSLLLLPYGPIWDVLFDKIATPLLGPYYAPLFIVALLMGLIYLTALVMYKRGIFLKL